MSTDVLRDDSEAELVVEWLSRSERDFLTPAVEAEMEGDELEPRSRSFSTALRAVVLRGKVVERVGSSALPLSSLVSGTLDRRLEDIRVMTIRSQPPSSSSVPCCWSAMLLSIGLLATGEVERRTSLLADRSRSRSRAIRTASRSNKLGRENLDEWPEDRTRCRDESRSSSSPVLAKSSLDDADPALRLYKSKSQKVTKRS